MTPRTEAMRMFMRVAGLDEVSGMPHAVSVRVCMDEVIALSLEPAAVTLLR